MSLTPAEAQDAFHQRLTGYVNGRFASRASLLVSFAAPALAYRREAGSVVRQFESLGRARPAGGAVIEVDVPAYAGVNAQVRRLMDELAPLKRHLVGACVHGSIGTGEEVAYSDFDALVILRDSAFESATTLERVAARLGALRGLMFEFDPLQHHGWFVLTEADLPCYCQAWFPTALYAHARALLPAAGFRLAIRPRDSGDEFRRAFANLAGSVLRQIEAGPPLADAYRLKNLMSEFMLLPSFYVQARDGAGVFKKQSFALAARDFPAATWSAMERVSAARLAWDYEISPVQRFALTRCVAQRRLVTRWARPRTTPALRAALPAEVWAGAAELVRAMQSRLGK